MKLLLIHARNSGEFEEREGWSDGLRREYDEAEIVLGLLPGPVTVILKGGRVDEFTVSVAKRTGRDLGWKLGLASYDEAEAVAESRKLGAKA